MAKTLKELREITNKLESKKEIEEIGRMKRQEALRKKYDYLKERQDLKKKIFDLKHGRKIAILKSVGKGFSKTGQAIKKFNNKKRSQGPFRNITEKSKKAKSPFKMKLSDVY